MSKLIFDIETVGENFDDLDEATQEVLTRWIKKESDNEAEYEKALKELKDGLGFSPLTGQIVAIGVLDYEKNKGVVYFQSPDVNAKEFEEGNISFKPCSEKEMLENFWKGAEKYNEFITFNGRGFDAPFLMVRSAVHKIKPTKDLMSNRYLSSQRFGASHIDLLDQLTFYGAVRKKGGLHLWCRAFDITSPKAQGVTGDDVAGLFKEKKYEEIARYNVGDLVATKELYDYWKNYLKLS
ncbi:MAG: ribonuclease H-like domain-containing protein [Candidatus Pacebacteria bacterium]|nr:ribonuclease H-like domain-containing protein [Candidatus Paceibacterota bacterium]NUQ57548.1 ribonuclease H-like domain-containing protein [Candidatus Paceibacter sp.]